MSKSLLLKKAFKFAFNELRRHYLYYSVLSSAFFLGCVIIACLIVLVEGCFVWLYTNPLPYLLNIIIFFIAIPILFSVPFSLAEKKLLTLGFGKVIQMPFSAYYKKRLPFYSKVIAVFLVITLTFWIHFIWNYGYNFIAGLFTFVFILELSFLVAAWLICQRYSLQGYNSLLGKDLNDPVINLGNSLRIGIIQVLILGIPALIITFLLTGKLPLSLDMLGVSLFFIPLSFVLVWPLLSLMSISYYQQLASNESL